MPTNKLWLEHTERAAWDSVEALREQLVQAERRLHALAPHVGKLPELLELLDRAKLELGLEAESYAELVQRLLERLQQADAAAAAAKIPQPIQVDLGYRELDPRPHRQPLDSDAELDDPADGEPDATEFIRTVQRRHSGFASALPRDLNRLLLLLEAKVDDLAELEGSELREAAVDLAILASCIDPASRRKG